MSLYTKRGIDVFAPTDAGGNPRGPDNGEAQVWAVEVERLIAAAIASGALVYATKAELDADLDHAANTGAWVVADGANNGIYTKSGASGTGSWTRVSDIPEGDPGSSDVVGTSSTSVAIGTGTKAFTIAEATLRGWGVGARLRITSDADNTDFMEGVVTAYSHPSLTVDITLLGATASGTHTDWTINLAGQPGSLDGITTGATGLTVLASATADEGRAALELGAFSFSSVAATASVKFDNAGADSRFEYEIPGTYFNDTSYWQWFWSRGSVTAPTRSGAMVLSMLSDNKDQRRNVAEFLRNPYMYIPWDYCAPADVAVPKATLRAGGGSEPGYVTVETLNGTDAPLNSGRIIGINGDPSGLTSITVGGTVYGVYGGEYTPPGATTTMPPGWVVHNEPGNFERTMWNTPSPNRNPHAIYFASVITVCENGSTGPLPRGWMGGALKPEDHQIKMRNYRGLIGTVDTLYCAPEHLLKGDVTTFDHVISAGGSTIDSLRRSDGGTTSIVAGGVTYNVSDPIPPSFVAHRGNLEQRNCGTTFNLISGDLDFWTSPDAANPRGINFFTNVIQRGKITATGQFIWGATTGSRKVEFHDTGPTGVRIVSSSSRAGLEFSDSGTTTPPLLQSIGNTLVGRVRNSAAAAYTDLLELKGSGVEVTELFTAEDEIRVGVGGSLIAIIFSRSVTFDVDNVPANSSATQNVAVTGVLPGDAIIIDGTLATSSISIVDKVAGTNIVTQRYRNYTGADVNLGNVTLKYTVIRIVDL